MTTHIIRIINQHTITNAKGTLNWLTGCSTQGQWQRATEQEAKMDLDLRSQDMNIGCTVGLYCTSGQLLTLLLYLIIFIIKKKKLLVPGNISRNPRSSATHIIEINVWAMLYTIYLILIFYISICCEKIDLEKGPQGNKVWSSSTRFIRNTSLYGLVNVYIDNKRI